MQLHTLVLHLRKIVIKVSKPATFLKLMFAHSVCNLFMYLRYTFLTKFLQPSMYVFVNTYIPYVGLDPLSNIF